MPRYLFSSARMYGTRRINGNGFGPTFLRKRKLAWTALSPLPIS